MSHHNESYHSTPAILTFEADDNIKLGGSLNFIIQGQGTIVVRDPRQQGFYLNLKAGDKILSLELTATATQIATYINGVRTQLASYPSAMDPDPAMPYWLSLDSLNARLKFGSGEVRQSLCKIDQPLSLPWAADIKGLDYYNQLTLVELYRDPVTIDPPLSIRPASAITIDDVALNRYAIPANLTPACQQLYHNISGENFKLNTPDFPHFTDAIEASIRNPNGWCYKKLQEKASEFGGHNIYETYLRITLGVNQGESPGIPYVVEIWPPDHYSPIHNHAGADAVIRVLYGSIQVSLFPMLSKYHETPFKKTELKDGEVTWISPRYNQTHQLYNVNAQGPTCITIQCYQYAATNTTHYKYFDYLDDKGQIQQFTPNSDAEYMEFKEIIRREWGG